MSKLKFFTDVHIDKAIVTQLRARKIDVLRCVDIGMSTAKDRELLEYAASNGYALLSMDRDMTRLHSRWLHEGKHHCGIFYAPMAQFQGEPGIGPIVRTCTDFAELIEEEAGTLEEDIHDQIRFISSGDVSNG